MNGESEAMDSEQVGKFTWTIENFSSIKQDMLFSDIFLVGGYEWRVLIFPKGHEEDDQLAIYLEVADSETLPHGWSRYAQFRLSVINQMDPQNSSSSEVTSHDFNEEWDVWGFSSFLPLTELHDPNKGYLMNDACLVQAEVSTERIIDLLSYEFIVETDSDELKVKEADHVTSQEFNEYKDFSSFLPLSELYDPKEGYLMNDACLVEAGVSTDRTIDLRPYEFMDETDSDELKGKEADHGQDETESSKHELPTAQPSSPNETTKPEDPIEEDIDTFFARLESDLASRKVYSSQEEAKEALAKIEEALKMTPDNFYERGKFSPLKKAFKVLSSSDCSSALTIEQKTELLAMEKNFRELPERVVKAMQDKNLFAEKESVKQTLSCNLEKSLNIFKESKAELKQVDEKIAALVQLKMKILGCRKEHFKTTKNMKMEREALEKEWPEYEAKAKAAEDEERAVAAQWSKMKDFIYALKEKI